jgi:hypothetical protein
MDFLEPGTPSCADRIPDRPAFAAADAATVVVTDGLRIIGRPRAGAVFSCDGAVAARYGVYRSKGEQ